MCKSMFVWRALSLSLYVCVNKQYRRNWYSLSNSRCNFAIRAEQSLREALWECGQMRGHIMALEEEVLLLRRQLEES